MHNVIYTKLINIHKNTEHHHNGVSINAYLCAFMNMRTHSELRTLLLRHSDKLSLNEIGLRLQNALRLSLLPNSARPWLRTNLDS